MFRYVLPAVAILALGATVVPMTVTPAVAQSGETDDTSHWDRVKQSKDPNEVRSYLEKFPNGLYAALARIRLRNSRRLRRRAQTRSRIVAAAIGTATAALIDTATARSITAACIGAGPVDHRLGADQPRRDPRSAGSAV